MSGWWVGGAIAGIAARRVIDKQKNAQQQRQLEMQTNAIQVSPITPPLMPEAWFTAGDLFSFGMPKNYSYANPRAMNWPMGPPVTAVQDDTPGSDAWLAVMGKHLSLEFDPGHSVWIAAINPNECRKAIGNWGGSMMAGPTPIQIGGERGLWMVIDTNEQGQTLRKYTVLTMHRGYKFEIIMNIDRANEKACGDAYWTAIGSWQWGDVLNLAATGPAAQVPAPPPVPALGAATAPAAATDDEYQVWVAENSISVSPIIPPLETVREFSTSAFSFSLPWQFGPAPDDVVRQWQSGWDSVPLLVITDHEAEEFSFLMAVFSGPAEHETVESMGSHSVWLLVALASELRQRPPPSPSETLVRGPEAVLVGGERGTFMTHAGTTADGVATMKWGVLSVRAFRGYQLMMFVRAEAEARYADVFWTAAGSWRWT